MASLGASINVLKSVSRCSSQITRRCGRPRHFGSSEFQNWHSLYLLTDDAYLGALFLPKIGAALEEGVTAVQLRLKHASTAEFVRVGQEVRRMTRDAGVPLIVDDRLDVALAVEADGLHVGETDLPWKIARRLLGPDRLLGCSTYGRADYVKEAMHPDVRADLIGSGSVFATPTKPSCVAKGAEHLKSLQSIAAVESAGRKVPVVAIGGVTVENAAECLDAGADGLAVVSAILGQTSLEGTRQAVRDLRSILQSANRL